MKTRNICVVNQDYDSQMSYQLWREDIQEIFDQVPFNISTSSSGYVSPCEDASNYIVDGKTDGFSVVAKGYSQGDYISYVITFSADLDKSDRKLMSVVGELLSRSFTHKNDYYAKLYKEVQVDREWYRSKDALDTANLAICHIEFPDEDDVKQLANEYFDFDEIEVKLH